LKCVFRLMAIFSVLKVMKTQINSFRH
jgi:hypothetical protein